MTGILCGTQEYFTYQTDTKHYGSGKLASARMETCSQLQLS